MASELAKAILHGKANDLENILNTIPKSQIDEVDSVYHTTALNIASQRGDVGSITLLLSAGANPKAFDPIHHHDCYQAAIHSEKLEAAVLLKHFLTTGSLANIDSRKYYTDVYAEIQKDKEITGEGQKLIAAAIKGAAWALNSEIKKFEGKPENNVFLHTSDDCGMNALHHAAKNGKTPAVEALIKAGINVNTLNTYEYKTALDYADENAQHDTIQKLQALGGKTASQVLPPSPSGGNGESAIDRKFPIEWLKEMMEDHQAHEHNIQAARENYAWFFQPYSKTEFFEHPMASTLLYTVLKEWESHK